MREIEKDDQQGARGARPNHGRRPAQSNARSYAVIGALLFVVGWGFLLTRPSTNAQAQRRRSPEDVSRDAGRRVDAASDEVGRWRKRYRQIGRALGGNDNARPDSSRRGSSENRQGSNSNRASNNNRADSANRIANANAASSKTPANGNASRPCRPPANSNGSVRLRRACS